MQIKCNYRKRFNAGQCLNFNCSFILILMLRQCITFLRTHGFNSVLPLDHHIYLHKMSGVLIGVCSVVHTMMHLLNFGTREVSLFNINAFTYCCTYSQFHKM